jgi:hypothetical protein
MAEDEREWRRRWRGMARLSYRGAGGEEQGGVEEGRQKGWGFIGRK